MNQPWTFFYLLFISHQDKKGCCFMHALTLCTGFVWRMESYCMCSVRTVTWPTKLILKHWILENKRHMGEQKEEPEGLKKKSKQVTNLGWHLSTMNISILGSKRYGPLHCFRLCAVSSPSIINDHPCIISSYRVPLKLRKAMAWQAYSSLYQLQNKTAQYVLTNSLFCVSSVICV